MNTHIAKVHHVFLERSRRALCGHEAQAEEFAGALARVMAVLGVPLDVGPAGYCLPRHRVPFNSRDKGSKCVE